MGGTPPAYDTPAYWEARFASDLASGTHFEWLGSGADTLLPPFVQHISAHAAAQPAPRGAREPRPAELRRASSDQTVSPGHPAADPIRCLNIGCGSSALHVLTGAAWVGAHLPRHDYWNLDYAASAIMAAQQLEPPAQGHESMRYVVGDLLDWQALMHQIQAELSPPSPAPGDASEEKEGSMEAVTDPPRTAPPFLFDIVLDKSTSDAIATGPDVVFGEAEEMEEMLSMLQRGTSSSSSLEKDRKDEASDSSTGSTAAAATAEPCCPLFPPEWYALHMPGSDSSFQQYLDYLVLHSQSDPNSSLHSISLSSTPASNSNANSRTASNNALSNMSPSDKKLPPHLPLPGSASSRYDCARPAVAHSDMGEREVSSSAISSESAESAPKSHPVASGTQPSLGSGSGSGSGLGSGSGSGSGPGSGSGSGLGSGESGRSGNSNANSNTNNSSTSLGSSKAVHRVDPLVVLATHLAALVRPGGVWLIMSYSADRCAFLERPLHSPHHTPFARRHPRAPPSGGAQAHGAAPAPPAALRHPSDFWTLEDTQAIPITSESGSAPPIFHHRYVLRRTV